MDREHVFTLQTRDGDVYECRLLAEAEVSNGSDGVTARLPWAGIESSGPTEADALQGLLGELGTKTGESFFREYIEAKGRKLSRLEADRQAEQAWKARSFRADLSPDEQYDVALLAEAEVTRDGDTVTARLPWIDMQATGPTVAGAFGQLLDDLEAATGYEATPGPRYEPYANYARAKGTAVAPDVLAAERADKEAYERSKGSVEAIAPDDIDGLSRQGVPLLVDFWAEWCGPCRAIAPVIAELQSEWDGRMLFRKIDVEEHQDSGERYGFRGIPCLIIFRDGQEIHRIVGFGGREHLVGELEPLLS